MIGHNGFFKVNEVIKRFDLLPFVTKQFDCVRDYSSYVSSINIAHAFEHLQPFVRLPIVVFQLSMIHP